MVVNGKERICFFVLFCFVYTGDVYSSSIHIRTENEGFIQVENLSNRPAPWGGGNIYNFPPVTERGHDAWPRVLFLLGELGDDADERAVFVAQPLVVRLQLLQGLQIVEDKSALGEV